MRALAFTLLISILGLAACTSLPTQSRAPTATAIPVPSLAPAQVLELTPHPAPTLTPSSPTETLIAPTLTPAAPTETLTAPTATPEDTSTPAPFIAHETPAATSTMTLQSAPAVACYNGFYPVSPDARWEYRVTADATPSTYDKSIVRMAPDSFTEHRVFNSTATDNAWTCTIDGLRSEEFGNLQVHGQTQYKFNTTSGTGVTIPAEDRWFVGNAWSSRYDIAGQLEQSGVTFTGTGTVTLENRIGAEDPVTVPAGTFNAFRVDSTITLRLTPSGLFAIPVTVTLSQYSWYARDTGMVRSMLSMNGATAVTELVSYTP